MAIDDDDFSLRRGEPEEAASKRSWRESEYKHEHETGELKHRKPKSKPPALCEVNWRSKRFVRYTSGFSYHRNGHY